MSLIALSVIFSAIGFAHIATGTEFPIMTTISKFGPPLQILFTLLIGVAFASLFQLIRFWLNYKAANAQKIEALRMEKPKNDD